MYKKIEKNDSSNWAIYVKEHPRQFEKLSDYQDLKIIFQIKKILQRNY